MSPPKGTRSCCDRNWAQKGRGWMQAQDKLLMTDTTMRDAHQSLLATRMRSST